MSDIPVILLAFANDRQGRFLRSIAQENQLINEQLKEAEQAKLCEVITLPSANIDTIIDTIKEVRGRLKIFHYGGHADGYNLLISSGEAAESIDATAFARFLGTQESLQFVFLNGCSTLEQAQELVDAGIPQAIVTNKDIVDEVAKNFAKQFYQSLADGQTIGQCFIEAESGTQAKHGSDTRSLILPEDVTQSPVTDATLPWKLFTHPSAKTDWTIKEREIDIMITKAQKQLTRGRIKGALQVMADYLKEKDLKESQAYSDLIGLYNRFKTLDKDIKAGVISYDTQTEQMARIRRQILSMLSEMRGDGGRDEVDADDDPFD